MLLGTLIFVRSSEAFDDIVQRDSCWTMVFLKSKEAQITECFSEHFQYYIEVRVTILTSNRNASVTFGTPYCINSRLILVK